MDTQKVVRKIYSVKVERLYDDSPDTSWLGEYSDTRTSEYSIDRAHSEDCLFVDRKRDDYGYTHDLNTDGTADSTYPTCDNCGIEGPQGALEPCSEYDWEQECNCSRRGRMDSREYRYFNPSFNYVDKFGKALPENTPEEVREYVRQDYGRMESLSRGDWTFIGIRAVARVGISLDGGASFKCDTLTSGGLWGIESDSQESYFAEVAQEELSNLKGILLGYGFGRSIVGKAIKNAEMCEELQYS